MSSAAGRAGDAPLRRTRTDSCSPAAAAPAATAMRTDPSSCITASYRMSRLVAVPAVMPAVVKAVCTVVTCSVTPSMDTASSDAAVPEVTAPSCEEGVPALRSTGRPTVSSHAQTVSMSHPSAA